MNKMRFDKIMINNNNDNNNNDNQKEEFKNNQNKDIIEPEPEKNNDIKSPDEGTDKKNKFDDRLLDSQAFEPEKIQRIAMDEIPGPDDFNFGQDEVVNPYETNDNNNNDKKKDDLNFGPSSPIGDNHFNFDRQSNLSLGSEIKKIDEENQFPNLNGNASNKNNDKLKMNDSNAFNFEYKGEKDNNIKRESKELDTFNFNTADNQKEGDDWDF